MQTTHIWNKLNLRRNKVVLLGLVFFLAVLPTFGQGMFGMTSTSGSDNRTLSYGFFLAAHTSTLRLKYSDAFLNQQANETNLFASVRSIEPKFSPGFSLGFIGILRFHDQMSLLFTPKVGFYEYKTDVTYFYSPIDPANTNSNVASFPEGETYVTEYASEETVVELPLLFKYRSVRFNNTRMYWLGGASYQFRTKSQDEANVDDIVLTGQDFSLEAGMGFEIYFKYFKFAPEIRFSHGLNNLYQAENTRPELRDAISSIKKKSITIYLNFQ
ncbi:type IX secretion/gliding motility protein PorT/SprT [Algoriphagus chordae]|uniref:Outer membrane protein with beta-barrel domain n=1 Tax=Algoriphagus chordae TaxID=237019 RepID=A0A2W7R218_9BACT|nr:outer membrane beta-barrel protein [Algoriphagus chordae]PZX53266.1 outer membrane protein with beta-barrel domain [Algoriphagus chordae]